VTEPLLVLLRHGQTDANVAKALDTRPPGAPLNVVGRAQALAAAARLADEPITAVYASTAVRAQQTAAPIAERHGLSVTVVDGVQEVFCGDLEGRADPESRALFEEVYAGWSRGEPHRRLPGGESAADLAARFLPVIDRLWRMHDTDGQSGQLLVASHGAAIRIVAGALIGAAAQGRYVPNAGRVVLARRPGAGLGPGGWELRHWDEAPAQSGDATGGADD
jgi:probable phosphoglycerate mutase